MTTPSVLNAVLGTAGHIDHGKSSLVRALTGVNPDRFREEQERGMTIDIGFAEYRTPSGTDVGLIDVPGHEKFVRNMVAGASGMDMVMLVIAADDGVMPQTREHLEIMSLLGITRGFVVVTKVDTVDADLVELVVEEIAEFVEGTFLEGAPVLPCSSITGLGMDAVKEQIHELVASLPPRENDGVFRMPIQRSFTLKGHGTVVTGVPVSGGLSVGDQVEVLPRGANSRVRGLHVHHAAVETAGTGLRVAVNLADVNWREVQRGDVLATPGYFQGTRMVEARFTLLQSWPGPLKNDRPVRFHVGATEALGRLVLLDKKVIEPGEDALVQIRLEEEVVVAPGDHYLLRLASPERTIGGGLVLGESRFRFKRFRDWVQENMQGKEATLADRGAYLEYVVRAEGLRPAGIDHLAVLVKEPEQVVREGLEALAGENRLVAVDQGRAFLHADMVDRGAELAQKSLLELHEADHYPFGFPVSAVGSRMKHPLPLAKLFLERAREQKKVVLQGEQYKLRAFKGSLSNEDRRLLGKIEERLQETGLEAPNPGELAEELNSQKKRVLNVLKLLEGQGRVHFLAENVWVHHDALVGARDRVIAHCEEHGEAPSNQMKDVLGATRKYVIPLLERLDADGITERRESVRVLKEGWRERIAGGEGPG